MSTRFFLEDFDGKIKPKQVEPEISESDLEEQVLASFENGYKAGWDDATNAHSKEQDKFASDFANNLEDLSFTYHEARSHVLTSLEPLLQDIIARVLPEVAVRSLGQQILEQLLPIAEGVTDIPVELVVNPASRRSIEPLITEAVTLPIQIVEQDSLSPGQAFLKLGSTEKKIDMTTAIEKVGQAVDAFFEQHAEEMKEAG